MTPLRVTAIEENISIQNWLALSVSSFCQNPAKSTDQGLVNGLCQELVKPSDFKKG